MKVKKTIEVWLINKRLPRPIDLVQFDTGIQLVFALQDFTVPDGTTATLYVQKPSGKFVYQETGITASGNTVTISLENQAITEHGNSVPYQVQLKNGTDLITTFAGIFRVEKSLKDSGATQSKTVIAAFEAKTAEQIAQIEAAAQEQIALIQAEFPELYALKDQVTLLTNSTANGIKGKLSGAVVFADDVSPVEHSPAVRVHGKNLFDTSKIAVQANTDNIYISAVGEGYIDITTKEAYDGNGHCVTWVKLKELCPQMQAGKQYALSGTTTAWNKMIYLKEIDLFWSYGTRQVVTEEMLECTIGFYGLNSIREQGFGTCRISNIQCEEGYDITEYTPYIDPSTVTVTRCGKNLYDNSTIADKYVETSGYRKYKLLIPNGDYRWNLRANTFFGSGCYAIWTDDELYEGGDQRDNCFYNWIGNSGVERECPNEGGFTVTKGYVYMATTGAVNGIITEFIEKFETMQLEVGSVATAFEPYNGAEYTPEADGTVPDITSISPSMTILTDNDGVIVECEYIRDTNKVIDKLINAITALGGTV